MAFTSIHWDWREAFSKFGFNDGDGWNGTDIVSDFMEKEFGVKTECDIWGCHNYMIFDVLKDGVTIIPQGDDGCPQIGYDEPDDWLPKEWVEALDEHFDEMWEGDENGRQFK